MCQLILTISLYRLCFKFIVIRFLILCHRFFSCSRIDYDYISKSLRIGCQLYLYTIKTKLDEYLGKYGSSEIGSFCNGIKKDITPVKNAISLSVNSGFVEGNNNKFKVLKRIVYGRSRLVNLEKKCKLAFLPKNQDFSLSALL